MNWRYRSAQPAPPRVASIQEESRENSRHGNGHSFRPSPLRTYALPFTRNCIGDAVPDNGQQQYKKQDAETRQPIARCGRQPLLRSRDGHDGHYQVAASQQPGNMEQDARRPVVHHPDDALILTGLVRHGLQYVGRGSPGTPRVEIDGLGGEVNSATILQVDGDDRGTRNDVRRPDTYQQPVPACHAFHRYIRASYMSVYRTDNAGQQGQQS